MASSTLQLLKTINDHFANQLLVLVAVISAIVAYLEYSRHRRPYVLPEMVSEKVEDRWYFHVFLVNKGEYPAIARISEALLKIGDEEYPTMFKLETVLSPGERHRLVPLGHINENGRQKILGHEYMSNRVEISVCIESKSLGQKSFKYKTRSEYEINVASEKPLIFLTKEEMI